MNRKRMHSRSNEAIQNLINALDTTPYPSTAYTHTSIHHILNHELGENELYKESYHKIQKIKSILVVSSSKQLMQELNDIIDLIKGERVKAKFTIQELCKSAQQGQGKLKVKDLGVNTDSFLDQGLEESADVGVQTDQRNEIQVNQRKFQCYYKIVCMIDKLKVDYRQILPVLTNLPSKYVLPNVQMNRHQYKSLKNQQILKLQKVFITKIHAMMNADSVKTPTKERKSKQEPSTLQSDKSTIKD